MPSAQVLTEPEFTGDVEIVNRDGGGRVVLVCEHASNVLPPEYGTLGLPAEALESHIAWDPGARAVALGLSRRLDAVLVASRISRLVYDLNRPPEAPSATPVQSEVWRIPGNENLSAAERVRRGERYHRPFHAAVDAVIAANRAAGRAPVLVTVHSFTPVFNGRPRAVEVGILHDADTRLADRLLAALVRSGRYRVARNEPYGPVDGVTHTLRLHGLRDGLPNVMIEVRNDLIATPADQEAMADWLAAGLTAVLEPATPDFSHLDTEA